MDLILKLVLLVLSIILLVTMVVLLISILRDCSETLPKKGGKSLSLKERIVILEERSRAQVEDTLSKHQIITCDGCGCAVLIANACRGESQIKERSTQWIPSEILLYIDTPCYCRRCYMDLKAKSKKGGK